MDSRSGSGDISDDCGELSRLRRERHRLLLRVSEGRISVAAGGGNRNKKKRKKESFMTFIFRLCHTSVLKSSTALLENCGMMGGVSSSRSSTPPAIG